MNKMAALLIFLMISESAFSTVLHWPECAKGTLSVQNKSHQNQKFWLQKFDPTLNTETETEISGLQNLKIEIIQRTKTERNSLLHFSANKDFDVTYTCAQKNYPATSLEGGVQTFRKSNLIQQSLYLKNLFTNTNYFKIETLNKLRQPLKTQFVSLKPNAQRTIMLQKASDIFYIRVRAENKFSVFNLNSMGSENAMIVDTDNRPEILNAVFFEIAPRTGSGDSFIAQIKDPLLIAKARLQISNPALEKMLFAKIQKGHNNQNRNLASVTKSFWNWSVAEVTNIADIGSTACNGLPQIVDDRIDTWAKDPGRICFWTYRIKREVPASEVATGQKTPF
jgi:hypothetical protein